VFALGELVRDSGQAAAGRRPLDPRGCRLVAEPEGRARRLLLDRLSVVLQDEVTQGFVVHIGMLIVVVFRRRRSTWHTRDVHTT
jgi:hypothetical protein